MKYCYECGTKLTSKFLELEGNVPFCPNCNEFRFPIFSTAVSMVIVNKEKNKTLLIKQYGRDLDILVAGYVNKGETLEHAVRREIMEEVGLEVETIRFQKSEYFEKSNTILCNFYVEVKDTCVNTNKEVDSYKWYDIDEAYKIVDKTRLVGKFYSYFYEQKKGLQSPKSSSN